MKTKRVKQAFTTAPKKGKVKSAGHGMGNTFASSPKKPESDMPPRTRAASRAAREKRLTNKFI